MTGAPCSRRAPSAVQPPPHSGLQINLLMGDTSRPLLKDAFFLTFSGLTYTRAKQFRDIFGGINSLKLRSGFINICNSILVVTVRVHTL